MNRGVGEELEFLYSFCNSVFELTLDVQNGDYPFKFGTYMGCDAGGNRYYENRVDYPFGQHRWVEPGDIHNFDASQIPPEWHLWMHHVNDVLPHTEDEYFENQKQHIYRSYDSDAPAELNIGHQEKFRNFNHMHNQSQIRSRGYGIGNYVVGLPPHAPDGYYTQPGSPYNPSHMRKFEMIGDLDADKGGGRPYKSELWRERLETAEEKAAARAKIDEGHRKMISQAKWDKRSQALRARGGTVANK